MSRQMYWPFAVMHSAVVGVEKRRREEKSVRRRIRLKGGRVRVAILIGGNGGDGGGSGGNGGSSSSWLSDMLGP